METKKSDSQLSENSAEESPATKHAVESVADLMSSKISQRNFKEANDVFIEATDNFPTVVHIIATEFRNQLYLVDMESAGLYPFITDLVSKRKFAELDACADKLRASGKTSSDGLWYLDSFYSSVNVLDGSSADSDWAAQTSLLKDWIKARPNSDTAKLALADHLNDYAWKGVSPDNTDKEIETPQWSDRVAQAKAVLQQVKTRPPEWYSENIRLARKGNIDRQKIESLVTECQRKYPTYYMVISCKIYSLFPRWTKQQRQVTNFITESADALPGEQGDILYALGAWHVDTDWHNVFESSSLQWPRIKQGMLDLLKKYPTSMQARGELSVLAIEADDKITAKSAFQH
jgi:Domain of unknown function (DUF4034)